MRHKSRREDQITLRGFDSRLAARIRQLAREQNISLNRAALRLLQKGAGLAEPTEGTGVGRSLDELIGTWSEEEAKEFLRSIRSSEQIDKDFWK